MALPDDIWSVFEHRLLSVPSSSLAALFNPYNSVDPRADRPDADRIRKANLRRYVDCFAESPRVLLVGEAPGRRGCRFSGVPFTSEQQLVSGEIPFTGAQSSQGSVPFTERSASAVWSVVGDLHPDVFLWNAVPLHPHDPANPTENRTPTVAERRLFLALTDDLLGVLKPTMVVAAGRVAEDALKGRGPRYVRHPSRGGAAEFRWGFAEVRLALGV